MIFAVCQPRRSVHWEISHASIDFAKRFNELIVHLGKTELDIAIQNEKEIDQGIIDTLAGWRT